MRAWLRPQCVATRSVRRLRSRPCHTRGVQHYAAPQTTTASHLERDIRSLHLLRALLRECTYLPDSHARVWTTAHVLSRFRAYTSDSSRRSISDDATFDLAARLNSKQDDARKQLARLRRANGGERPELLRVLLMAYGRVGRRRRDLLKPLLAVAPANMPDPVVPNTLPASELEAGPAPPSAEDINQDPLAPNPYTALLTPQLLALAKSQISHPPPHLTRAILRRLQPQLEERNAWLRPMPRVRVANQMKDWYAKLLDRLHPPLPTAEFGHLGNLAAGRRTDATVPRRAARTVDRTGPRSVLEMVVRHGKITDREALGGDVRRHVITPRSMQRLWEQVFAQCCAMRWEGTEGGQPGEGQWTVQWGLDDVRLGIGRSRDMSSGGSTGGSHRERNRMEDPGFQKMERLPV